MSTPDKSPAILREAAPTPSVITKPALMRATPARRLWLCIYLPALPLEALNTAEEAMAVFEDVEGMRRILLADKCARAEGVSPGLAVNAALALLPTLNLFERSLLKERQALKTLASWAEQFTSFVCLDPPDVLLLEIAGSLKLFGGLSSLEQRITAGLNEQGMSACLSIAPTPLSSTWLARAGRRASIVNEADLTGALSRLPIHCLGWPDSVNESLRGMGITRVGDCLRLPREGFARRFGASRLLELDRALGRLPDPRQPHRAPERFCSEYELSEEESASDLLLNVCQELLIELERFLLTRQLSVQRILFSFFHLQEPATHLTLGCVEGSRSIEHWFELLKIKFDRLELPAPVIAVRLRSGRSQSLTAKTESLRFDDASKRQGEPIAYLVERISARIGDESVHGVTTVAEHRPQYAWSLKDPAEGQLCDAVPISRRPLWLLPKPRPLRLEQDVPRYQGALKLKDSPERLETGWWDDDGIARDYYVAVNPAGIHVWVYRDRRSACWYLHGIFG
ncbi:MAG: DNA polymerase Y family protein [Woeseiaceae bacterium]